MGRKRKTEGERSGGQVRGKKTKRRRRGEGREGEGKAEKQKLKYCVITSYSSSWLGVTIQWDSYIFPF